VCQFGEKALDFRLWALGKPLMEKEKKFLSGSFPRIGKIKIRRRGKVK
jgi:hypothetical protein